MGCPYSVPMGVCLNTDVKPEWLGNFFLKIAALFFILTR